MRVMIAAGVVLAGISSAAAADMTGAELTDLLQDGKTVTLGGEGLGYQGSLAINADGTASGSAKPDKGDIITIDGTWRIKGDKFCRKWKGLDKGREVCETWRKDGDNKVIVMVGKKQAGVNSW